MAVDVIMGDDLKYNMITVKTKQKFGRLVRLFQSGIESEIFLWYQCNQDCKNEISNMNLPWSITMR